MDTTHDAVYYALAELAELRDYLSQVDSAETTSLEEEIGRAKRIFIGGNGRSLLSMQGFAMRLMQTDHETYLVGGVCTPSIRPGDLLITASGSGTTGSTLEMVRKAKKYGARVALITRNPVGSIAQEAECVVALPSVAQCAERWEDMRPDNYASLRSAGDIFECAVTLLTDAVIIRLKLKNKLGHSAMHANHANLE